MVAGDLPSITNSAYASTSYVPDTWTSTTTVGGLGVALGGSTPSCGDGAFEAMIRGRQNLQQQRQQIHQEIIKLANPSRRIVKVIIIDPDDRVPLDKCILFSGDEKLTDLTDQELFFEVEIKSLLDKHNEYRKTVVDKKVKERTENLEPIKIRDLRMVVVDVAKF